MLKDGEAGAKVIPFNELNNHEVIWIEWQNSSYTTTAFMKVDPDWWMSPNMLDTQVKHVQDDMIDRMAFVNDPSLNWGMDAGKIILNEAINRLEYFHPLKEEYEILYRCWDKKPTANAKIRKHWEKPKPIPIAPKNEILFAELQLKSGTVTINCEMPHRRVAVKEGDFVIKDSHGWIHDVVNNVEFNGEYVKLAKKE